METNNSSPKALETLKGHSGKNVRALACSEGLIATGGDDGAIKLWGAKEILENKAKKDGEEDNQVKKVNMPLPQTNDH